MESVNEIKALVPDYAKDVRLSLDGAIARSSLPASAAANAIAVEQEVAAA